MGTWLGNTQWSGFSIVGMTVQFAVMDAVLMRDLLIQRISIIWI
jgi:hypothetical protein